MPGHVEDMQRHHILPCQLAKRRDFQSFLNDAGGAKVVLGDFRTNGLLLPSSEIAALHSGLPLHRGPHPQYNELVTQRVAGIERDWAIARSRHARFAASDALGRLALLQAALRRRLLDDARPLVLNRRDPLGRGLDFSELDAMADVLWSATARSTA